MKRNALIKLSSAWALVAYVGFVLLAAPCTCLAKPVETASATACCCGPEAANPCAPKHEGQERGGCDSVLGAGCAQALPEAAVADAPPLAEELAAPAHALSFELASPEAVLVSASRARTPSPPAPRLDQVRSTVLLI